MTEIYVNYYSGLFFFFLNLLKFTYLGTYEWYGY